MASLHQQHVADYHAAMASGGQHGGHNMYLFHRNWHRQNRDPIPPTSPDRNWGMDLVFGTNFLQMHHEMVKATATEPHFHMMHDSLVVWYEQQGINLPSSWDPLQPIPAELGYSPDPSVFPDEIQQAISNWAQQQGTTVDEFLTHSTNNPQFTFPKYFTRQGVDAVEPGEPITGARKLADFKNTNQLGCCIVFPHNEWHGTIGGAMGTTWTAIADPIFYFGVHWYLDRVFDEYKSIQAEHQIRPLDRVRLFELDALPSEKIEMPEEFSSEQKKWVQRQIEFSQKFNR